MRLEKKVLLLSLGLFLFSEGCISNKDYNDFVRAYKEFKVSYDSYKREKIGKRAGEMTNSFYGAEVEKGENIIER